MGATRRVHRRVDTIEFPQRLGEFGTLWRLPNWLLDLSPFAHSPKLPGGAVSVSQFALLLVAAVLLAALGFVRWRNRDVQD